MVVIHLNVCITDFNGFSMEIGGLEWMGVVHGEIIVNTLPQVLNHL
jgi:hypothetical protein